MTGVPPAVNPMRASPPILALASGSGRFDRLCGSGFLIARDNGPALIVTAAHVVQDEPDGVVGRRLAIAVEEEGTDILNLVPVQRWHIRSDLDLAVGVVEYDGLCGFQMHEGAVPRNRDVVTIEHSGSITQHKDKPGTSVIVPLLRKGYMVQSRRGLHPAMPDVVMHELSYPALKGASGAPVFLEDTNRLIGVVVANYERELLPSQVLQAFRDDGPMLEEFRYFLPNALAVAHLHVEALVTEALAVFESS